MKNKLFLIVLVVCIGICFAACTTFQASGLQMGTRESDYQVLGDFSTKVWVHKFLGTPSGPTLFNIGSDISEGILQRTVMSEVQARGGTSAINVQVKWGSNPLQMILNFFTFSIWAPSTLTVSGTVIKER